MKCLLFLFGLVFISSVFAGAEVATATMVRGDVDVLTLGKTKKLEKGQSVEEGSVVKTGEKSFVKLVFTDKSQMNIGPKSEMKIEKFSGKDSGVIDLVKGQIRSQVSKDYLQMQDKSKSKMFIKTSNAVMGIRGTDFMISTNGQATTAVLFEGQVVFNNTTSGDPGTSSDRLENIVNEGVQMHPGEFSVADPTRSEPTQPALLNIQQRDALEKNENFESDRSPSSNTSEINKTIVPEGLTGQVVSNSSETLKNEVAKAAGVPIEAQEAGRSPTSADPNGMAIGDSIKPANGSFVHLESGVIIPPAPGSILDANTNTYLPAPGNGKVAADGSYIPPKNIEISATGEITKISVDANGNQVTQKLPPPSPVFVGAPVVVNSSLAPMALGALPPPKMGDFPPGMSPGGSLLDPTNALRNNPTGITATDIFINNTLSNVGKLNIQINGPQ